MKSNSLRLVLLRRLLPAMLALLLAGAGTAYWVALGSAGKAYDRSLLDTTLAIAEQLRVVDGQVLLPLTPQARAVLLTDKFDRIFYAVRNQDGGLLDGDPELPQPPAYRRSSQWIEAERIYYDGQLHGRPVRVAALRSQVGGQVAIVLAAETLVKRNALVREVIFGMLLPELLLILVCLGVVWFGVRSGLYPLRALREALAARSPADLRPVDVAVPDEIQPVVTEINELLGRLDRSLASQRNFVSDAAHQLRTPIAALLAQVEASRHEPADGREARLDGIHAATRRLAHLVDQMLALARAEPSAKQTQAVVVLPELLGKAAETWLPPALAKGIDLGFELAPAAIHGNELLLQELLSNLLDNAIRHTPAGGTITVGCGERAGGAWLSVEDSGPGLADDAGQIERLFERFYRPPGSPGEGSGLGLAIVRQIATQHGGQVTAGRSGQLGGAAFTVFFRQAAPGSPAELPENATGSGAGAA